MSGDSGKSEGERSELEAYANNIEERVKNLEDNYLEGAPSMFLPDDMTSEMKSAVA